MYINGASAISPLPVFDALNEGVQFTEPEGARAKVSEPDYSKLIDPKLIRRMSRIIRMGVATAMDALKQAGLQQPDAIITGTAYGCLDDTGIFLRRLVENQEEMLTPTAFIQSTHNTVGAQVALMLKCHSYNNTYVQRSQSFELSLHDSRLWLTENPDHSVLVGAADELTDYSFALLQRFGLFRYHTAGEGAAYFVIQNKAADSTWAQLKGVRTLFRPDAAQLDLIMKELLALAGGSVDLLLSGERRGDPEGENYKSVKQVLGAEIPVLQYKNYCGEYPTASAFATWLAAWCLKQGKLEHEGLSIDRLRNVLIYQADAAGYHSFILLSHVKL